MKSYKDTTRSYKDLDKEIILNAPEGAMWYNETNKLFYRYFNEIVELFGYGGWRGVGGWSEFSEVQANPECLIPLPNIEIPWVATADSACPVPEGCPTLLGFDDENNDTVCDPQSYRWRIHPEFRDITSYKIIDEEFLDKAKPIQEEPINVPELEMHRAAYQAIKNAGFESPEELLAEYRALREEDDSEVVTTEVKLFRKLRFLQNLANEFPGIRNEAIKFMECELDGYMNTLWEKDNDE